MFHILNKIYQGGFVEPKLLMSYAVINLVHPNDIKWCRKAEDYTILDSPFFHDKPYIRLPIVDGHNPGIKWLNNAVDIAEILAKEYQLYIHCYAGISRSVMLTAALIMKIHKVKKDVALEKIAEKNKGLNPSAIFIDLLKQYERHLEIF